MDRHGVFDLGLVGDGGFGVEDQRHICRGAAHVVGHEIAVAGALAGIGGGDDPRSRAGHHGLGRITRDETRRDHAAIAIHDKEIAPVAQPLQFAAQPVHIALEDRLHRGVHRRRHAALEFARFRQQRMARRDVVVRPEVLRYLGSAALMRGVGVGVEEVDDERLAAGGEQRLHSPLHFLFVERRAHRTRGFDAFGYFQPQIARDDRDKSAGHAVGLRTRAAAKLDYIAKAARGDHAGAGEAALQHCIGSGRGAVDD